MLLRIRTKDKAIVKNLYTLKISCMYFRVFIKFRVCTCIHDTRYRQFSYIHGHISGSLDDFVQL